jgi:hypothetical protein
LKLLQTSNFTHDFEKKTWRVFFAGFFNPNWERVVWMSVPCNRDSRIGLFSLYLSLISALRLPTVFCHLRWEYPLETLGSEWNFWSQ